MEYETWLRKFPQLCDYIDPDLFDILVVEALAEMGADKTRWQDDSIYDVAQGYLIAHLATQSESSSEGDHTPLQPYRSKQVDDVMVEYAVSRDQLNNFDPFLGTVYGQRYLRFRRMVFGMPRTL